MYKFLRGPHAAAEQQSDRRQREPVNNYLATAMPNTVDYRSWNNRVDYQ